MYIFFPVILLLRKEFLKTKSFLYLFYKGIESFKLDRY